MAHNGFPNVGCLDGIAILGSFLRHFIAMDAPPFMLVATHYTEILEHRLVCRWTYCVVVRTSVYVLVRVCHVCGHLQACLGMANKGR